MNLKQKNPNLTGRGRKYLEKMTRLLPVWYIFPVFDSRLLFDRGIFIIDVVDLAKLYAH